jgi:hypothetical protein
LAASHPRSAPEPFPSLKRTSFRRAAAAVAVALFVSSGAARAVDARRAISAATVFGGGTNRPKSSSCALARFSENTECDSSRRRLASTNASSAAYVAEPRSAPQNLASTLATHVAPRGASAKNDSRRSRSVIYVDGVSQSVSTQHRASSAPSNSPVSETKEGTCVACPLKWKNKTSPGFASRVSHRKPARTFAAVGALRSAFPELI